MNKKILIIVCLVFITIVGALGYTLGKNSSGGNLQKPLIKTTNQSNNKTVLTTTTAPKTNSIFTSQVAYIQGKITKVDDKTLTIEKTASQSASFPISNKFVSYVPKPNSPQATASADLKSIQTNKPALVSLELINGEYQIISVSYIPEAK